MKRLSSRRGERISRAQKTVEQLVRVQCPKVKNTLVEAVLVDFRNWTYSIEFGKQDARFGLLFQSSCQLQFDPGSMRGAKWGLSGF
jgi:hypothetical protein